MPMPRPSIIIVSVVTKWTNLINNQEALIYMEKTFVQIVMSFTILSFSGICFLFRFLSICLLPRAQGGLLPGWLLLIFYWLYN